MNKFYAVLTLAFVAGACDSPRNPEYITEIAKRCGSADVSSSEPREPCALLVGSNFEMLEVLALTGEGNLEVVSPTGGPSIVVSRESAIAILKTDEPQVKTPIPKT